MPFMCGTIYVLFSILPPFKAIVVWSSCNNGRLNISSGSMVKQEELLYSETHLDKHGKLEITHLYMT